MEQEEKEIVAKPLTESPNEAARHVRNVHLTFLMVAVYIAITIGSTTDEQLLRITPVRLPIFNVEIPILIFFVITPWILLLLHFNLLLQLYLLARKLFRLKTEINTIDDYDKRETMRDRLFPFSFSHIIVYEAHSRFVRLFFAAIIWTTVVILPLILLTWTQIRFIAYHEEMITWNHRIVVMLDILLLWTLWPIIVTPVGQTGLWWKRAVFGLFDRIGRGLKSLAVLTRLVIQRHKLKWQILYRWRRQHTQIFRARGIIALSSTSMFVLVIALFVAVVPDGRIERWVSEKVPARWFLDNDERDTTYFTLSRILFDLPGQPFRQNLDLREAVLVQGELEPYVISQLRSPDASERNKAQKKVAGLRLQGRDLRYANFNYAILVNADLRGANLQGADFYEARLQGANLEKANLQGALLYGGNLQGANLQETNLRGTNLKGANLEDALLHRADLKDAALTEANLQGAYLSWASLQGTYFWLVNFKGADLRDANLQGAHLKEANLQGAKLRGAQLQGANLQEANLQGIQQGFGTSKFENVTEKLLMLLRKEKFPIRIDFQGADMRRANLQGADLRYANLQGADLQEANLQGASLRVANLKGANLRGADLSLADVRSIRHGMLAANDYEKTEREIRKMANDQQWPSNLLSEVLKAMSRRVGETNDFDVVSAAQSPMCDSDSLPLKTCLVDDDIDTYHAKLEPYLAKLGCSNEHVALGILSRVFNDGEEAEQLIKSIAKALLEPTCKGGLLLPQKIKEVLRELAQE